MPPFVLPFEKPFVELLTRVRELRVLAAGDPKLLGELARLEEKTAQVARDAYRELSPMQKLQIARHPERPYTLDYAARLLDDWVELHGDRRFGDDAAVVAGLGRYHGRSVVVVGHQRGRDADENARRNLGMPHPEGYRKAVRAFDLADRMGLPILTFVDTPGAFPGIAAEERGQSEAIAGSLAAMSRVRVPVVATIVGEGGSGGALAFAVANRVLVLEFGCYTVISPEGCAAILWRDAARAPEAAERLKMTAPDLLRLGIVDEVVAEPAGGAHHDHDEAARRLDRALSAALASLDSLSPAALADDRYRRFRAFGALVA